MCSFLISEEGQGSLFQIKHCVALLERDGSPQWSLVFEKKLFLHCICNTYLFYVKFWTVCFKKLKLSKRHLNSPFSPHFIATLHYYQLATERVDIVSRMQPFRYHLPHSWVSLQNHCLLIAHHIWMNVLLSSTIEICLLTVLETAGKFKSKDPQGLFLLRTLFLACRWPPFAVFSYGFSSVRVCGKAPPLWSHFTWVPAKGAVSKYSHTGAWYPSTWIWCGRFTVQSIATRLSVLYSEGISLSSTLLRLQCCRGGLSKCTEVYTTSLNVMLKQESTTL